MRQTTLKASNALRESLYPLMSNTTRKHPSRMRTNHGSGLLPPRYPTRRYPNPQILYHWIPLNILPSRYLTPQYPTTQIPYHLQGHGTKDTLSLGKDMGPEIPYPPSPVNRQTPLST